MKFVRWLGAFGQGTSLSDAATWELGQTERQVAAEPLWRGQSLIGHVKIGLVIDEDRSVFASGWLHDAWTVPDDQGILRHGVSHRGQRYKRFKDMDRFLVAWKKRAPDHHGEAAFDATIYKAVVVKSTASEHGVGRAKRLAAELRLPLLVLEDERK
jgi:hypothetical protein